AEMFDRFFAGTAYHSVGAACVPGVTTSGVAIANRGDIVYVPDQPVFTFERGVTVAGWFKSTNTGTTQTLFRKRDDGTSSFALVINGGRYQFVVGLAKARAISVTAPSDVKPDVFNHVAGTYDGSVLRLYVNAREVASAAVTGSIVAGPGPLLMGNDGSERRFAGVIDDPLLATHALTADEVRQLNCVPQAPTVESSTVRLSTLPGQPATIDVAVTNNNPVVCTPVQFQLNTGFPDRGLTIDPAPFEPAQSDPVPSGGTTHFTITATPGEFIEPRSYIVGYLVFEPVDDLFVLGETIHVDVDEQPGCHVSSQRELMIIDPSVVDDGVRTSFDPASSDSRNGVWTFKHLIEAMAPSPDAAPSMVETILAGFTRAQVINGFTVEARPGMHSLVLDRWPRTPDGALDLAQAPLRLLAIVNRFDLRDLSHGDAGEGRFVFGFIDPDFPDFLLQATMIFEYKLPAATEADVLDWAASFHALGPQRFGESYNAALQQITERFVRRGARPDHVNGSALNAVRTNEVSFATAHNPVWQMRTFELSPSTGQLAPALLALTPDRSFNFTPTLASYFQANAAAIIADQHVVPAMFAGQPFQAGAVFNDLSTWFMPGAPSEVRHHFALNTCNGCHSFDETNTIFLQIGPRVVGGSAELSSFLTGTTVFDVVTGQPRSFNDLGRRNLDLKAIVCPSPEATAATRAALRKGINRVH
ncbi:MAG TPA: LamG domain-containing protein, partial [Kofleriaceae bacterium]|nr:LamG domain-containing protein [Kofleriaceae bacterium]